MISLGHNLFFFVPREHYVKIQSRFVRVCSKHVLPSSFRCVLSSAVAQKLLAAVARVILSCFQPCPPSLSVYAVTFDKWGLIGVLGDMMSGAI